MKTMVQKLSTEHLVLLRVVGMKAEVRVNKRLEDFLRTRGERSDQRVNLRQSK
jgi:hypothetical protein